MRTEEKPFYVFSQAVCALIEMEAMKAENHAREMQGAAWAYGPDQFVELIERYRIGHNDVLGLFNQ